MSKLDVASLAKKISPAPSEADIISAAPVGSNQPIETTQNDPTERRGTRYKDAKTGAMVKLNGKVKEVAFNRYEYDLLEQAATASGATITSFMRVAIMKAVKAELYT